jgi:hypothetical protein
MYVAVAQAVVKMNPGSDFLFSSGMSQGHLQRRSRFGSVVCSQTLNGGVRLAMVVARLVHHHHGLEP